jgi:hypothetical protein
MTAIFRRFCLGSAMLAVITSLLPANYPAIAYEVIPSAAVFYDRTGTAIPISSLRFTDGGWRRGRDQGYAFALQKNTSYFYLWINASNGKPIGSTLACDGNLVNGDGAPVPAGKILSYTLADLAGRGSIWLIAVVDKGSALLAWDLTDCLGQGNLKAQGMQSLTDEGGKKLVIKGDLIAADFEGTGIDLLQVIDPDAGEMRQWALDRRGLRLVRKQTLRISADSSLTVHGVKYVGTTRLPHIEDNVAYESATIVLHDKGYTIFRNEKALFFAPNCTFQPAICADKTLVFHLDQGFTDGLQDLARKNRRQAGAALDRLIRSLRTAQNKFAVWALINPIQEDRASTLFILDRLAAANIPFVLDYYSSDVTNLAYIKKEMVDYSARAAEALKGVSLDIDAPAASQDGLQFYSNRYGSKFIGVRFMERLAMDITAKNPDGQPMIADLELERKELSFDWELAEHVLKWADASGRFVLWSDPSLYLPYTCYSYPEAIKTNNAIRDEYIHRQADLATHYSHLIPIYDNNEGLKRCGVAAGNWLVTPRNFRIRSWEAIPRRIAAGKSGKSSLAGKDGFGISIQSWNSDFDPLLTAGTLPAEEIAIWTLDSFAKGAALVEFEPYFYFFAWPPSSTIPQSVEIPNGNRIGDPRRTLDLLFEQIGLK